MREQPFYTQASHVISVKGRSQQSAIFSALFLSSQSSHRVAMATSWGKTYKVKVYASAEKADTLPLFLLYPYMYPVVTIQSKDFRHAYNFLLLVENHTAMNPKESYNFTLNIAEKLRNCKERRSEEF